jgi:elongation factor P
LSYTGAFSLSACAAGVPPLKLTACGAQGILANLLNYADSVVMPDTSDIRNGLAIIWNGDIWSIIEFLHVKPGKGGAFVRTKLRNVRTGKVVDNTFRAGEKIETARVERRAHQFLYEDDLGLHFMNTETYEQITLPKDLVQGREFVKEGGEIDVLIHAETEQPLATEIAKSVELEVVQTDPGLKGDTATGATKPATLESGAVVNVPLFINEGDVIRVNTETYQYITRVAAAVR